MALIELRNVEKSYGSTQVLTDVNLSIQEGEFVAVLGFSGSAGASRMTMSTTSPAMEEAVRHFFSMGSMRSHPNTGS